ncbi:MAG TPA: PQQ-binding-like beta-propeller repeat protein [Puia sp.]
MKHKPEPVLCFKIMLILFITIGISGGGCHKNNNPIGPPVDSTLASHGSLDTADGIVLLSTDYDSNRSSSGSLTVLNLNGTLRWKDEFVGEALASPAYGNGVLFVSSSYGKLTAINAKTGSVIWTYKNNETTSSVPVVDHGTVFWPQNYLLYGFDVSTGNLTWLQSIPNLLPYAPVVDGNILYTISASFNTANYSISAVDTLSKSTLWTSSIGYNPPAGLLIAGGLLCFTNGIGNLVALDKTTGLQKWIVSDQQYDGQHIVVGNYIYTFNHTSPLDLYAFDVRTGGNLWQWKYQQSPIASFYGLYLYNGNVYAYGSDFINQFLAGVKPSTGDSVSINHFVWYYENPIFCGGSVYALRNPNYNPSAPQTKIMVLDPASFVAKDSLTLTGSGYQSMSIMTKSGKLLYN